MNADSIIYNGIECLTPYRNMIPPLTPREREDLQESLQKDIEVNGRITMPVVLAKRRDGTFVVIDGHNRLSICSTWAEDHPSFPPDVLKFHFIESKGKDHEMWMVIVYNLRRRQLDREGKERLIESLLRLDPTKSDRQIGKETKVDHKTVGKTRKRMEKKGEVNEKTRSEDTKGRSQPRKRKRKAAKMADVGKFPTSAKMADEDVNTCQDDSLDSKPVSASPPKPKVNRPDTSRLPREGFLAEAKNVDPPYVDERGVMIDRYGVEVPKEAAQRLGDPHLPSMALAVEALIEKLQQMKPEKMIRYLGGVDGERCKDAVYFYHITYAEQWTQIFESLKNLQAICQNAVYHCVCTHCKGKGCKQCRGSGLWSQAAYQNGGMA